MNKTRAEVLAAIADAVDALCDPRSHTERAPYWDRSRNRKWRSHTTTQPGLIAQLAEVFTLTIQDEAGGSRRVPSSKPPGSFDAIALHTEITLGAAKWCWNVEVEQRDTVEGNLRALVGRAPVMDLDQAAELLDELVGWQRRAEVITGWRSPAFWPRVTCPVCSAWQSIAVNLDRQAATCRECLARWDAASIGILAGYVTAMAAAEHAPVRRAA